MKTMLLVGVALMLVGAGLIIKGSFTTKQKHEANVFGATLSITEKEQRAIPAWLSGGILAIGAGLTITAAVKMAKGGPNG